MVNLSKRRFAQLLMLQPFILLAAKFSPEVTNIELEDDFILVNGWVLLKSDLF